METKNKHPVKHLHLTNGDSIVAYISDETDSHFLVKGPYKFYVTDPHTFSLVPYFPLSDIETDITLPKDKVFLMSDLSELGKVEYFTAVDKLINDIEGIEDIPKELH